MERWYVNTAPRSSPRTWMFLNGTLLVASGALLGYLFFYIPDENKQEALKARPRVRALYLLCNVTSTIVWCLQVSLKSATVIYKKRHKNKKSKHRRWTVASLVLESLIAIYMILESLHVLYKWKLVRKRNRQVEAEVYDLIVTALAYAYAFLQSRRYKRIRKKDYVVGSYRAEPSADFENPEESVHFGPLDDKVDVDLDSDSDSDSESDETTPLLTKN